MSDEKRSELNPDSADKSKDEQWEILTRKKETAINFPNVKKDPPDPNPWREAFGLWPRRQGEGPIRDPISGIPISTREANAESVVADKALEVAALVNLFSSTAQMEYAEIDKLRRQTRQVLARFEERRRP